MDIIGILQKIGFDFRIFLFNLINFAVIAFLLYKFVFKKLSIVLAERQKVIEASLSNQKKSENLLLEAELKGKQSIEESRLEALKIIENAEKLKAGIIDDARIESDVILEKANKRGDELIEDKKRVFNKDSTELIVLAAKKLIESKEDVKPSGIIN